MSVTPNLNQTTRHESAVQAGRHDRQAMLQAMDALEAALAAGAVRNQKAWSQRVIAALAVMEQAMQAQTRELDSDEGLLAEILEQSPRFSRRVAHLREQFMDLVCQVGTLRKQFTDSADDDENQVGEVRQRLAWLLTAIRHFQACESDLIQDAFTIDIGVGD